jgi:hypothetical protein
MQENVAHAFPVRIQFVLKKHILQLRCFKVEIDSIGSN